MFGFWISSLFSVWESEECKVSIVLVNCLVKYCTWSQADRCSI